MITKFLPLPADTGGKRRSLAILEQYLDRGASVTLCAHNDGRGDTGALEQLGVRVHAVPWMPGIGHMVRWFPRFRSLLLTRFWSPDLLAIAMRESSTIGPFDVLQIEYLQNVPYATVPAAVKVLDLHDVVSAQTARIATVTTPPLRAVYALEARLAARVEHRAMAAFDIVACVSEADARQLPRADIVVAPNGWDPGPHLPPTNEPVVTLTANFAFATNEDAAIWFVSAVWPAVKAAVPAAHLLLVGRDPTPAVRRLGKTNGVEVTGTVPSVVPYLQRSLLTVAPLRAGGGSRLKILEALEAGRPVVSTSLGMEGLEGLNGCGVEIADAPDEMARMIVELLADPARATKVGADGRNAVHERFLWSATLRPLFDAVCARVGETRFG